MQVIQHGFSIKNEVLIISSIKPGGSGEYQGQTYSASVKFRTTNIIEDPFENTLKESEEILEYRIPCSSNAEATVVTDLLRNLRSKKLPVFVNTSIPKSYDGDIYRATSIDTAEQFIALNKVQEKNRS